MLQLLDMKYLAQVYSRFQEDSVAVFLAEFLHADRLPHDMLRCKEVLNVNAGEPVDIYLLGVSCCSDPAQLRRVILIVRRAFGAGRLAADCLTVLLR